MQFAKRIEKLPPYLFFEISKKIAEKRAQGVDVISLGIGDPDLPTPNYVLESLHRASLDPPNHRYPESDGLPEMRAAIAADGDAAMAINTDAAVQLLGSAFDPTLISAIVRSPAEANAADGLVQRGAHGNRRRRLNARVGQPGFRGMASWRLP